MLLRLTAALGPHVGGMGGAAAAAAATAELDAEAGAAPAADAELGSGGNARCANAAPPALGLLSPTDAATLLSPL